MKLLPIILSLHCLSIVTAVERCEADIYHTEFRFPDEELAVLVIWLPAAVGAHNILPLCSNHTGLPIEQHCSYDLHDKKGYWNARHDNGTQLLNCSLIADNCPAQPFAHNLVMKNRVKLKSSNVWPAAKIGNLARTQELCLLETGLPLTRRCLYNSHNYTAEWEEKVLDRSECLGEINEDIITYDLDKLYQEVRANVDLNDTTCLEVATRLTNLLANSTKLRIATDLEISNNILETITAHAKDPNLLPLILEAINRLMLSDANVVRSSHDLGTPSTLLKTMDRYLDGMANILVPPSKCAAYYSGNLTSVAYLNAKCLNISGIVVYNTSVQPDFRYWYLNQSFNDVIAEPHVEAAVLIPNSVRNKLLKTIAGSMRISWYRNTNFFVNQENYEIAAASIVVQISIPDHKGALTNFVPVIFQNHEGNTTRYKECGNWDYHNWHSTARKTPLKNRAKCNLWHLPSVAALVGRVNTTNVRMKADHVVLTVPMVQVFDAFSIGGCIISLLALLSICLTGVFFKQWRSQAANILLLNICFVLTLIVSYFLFINISYARVAAFAGSNHRPCIVMGAFLQYTLLVLFLWMFFIAVLQYQRYVAVFAAKRTAHRIARFGLAAWSLPCIPTALAIVLDPQSYMAFSEKGHSSRAICCPSGLSLFLTMLLPICIIVIGNIGIFTYILCSICRSMTKFHPTQERTDMMVQVHLSFLLFFLLGIPWIFGILTYIKASTVYSVLFGLTLTLQALVLFVYFVVIDRRARYSWLKCCCGGKYYTGEDVALPAVTRFNFRR